MPQLLVSVRDAAEAAAALAGGADVVDVKEPARGALGAADPAVWDAVLRACSGRAPVSVALGEAAAVLWGGGVPADRAALPAGVRWAKLGPGGTSGGVRDGRQWELAHARGHFRPPPPAAGPFGWAEVAYADHAAADCPPPDELLAASADCEVFLLDTFRKDGRGLFDHLAPAAVARLCAAARARGLTVALAGSLRLEDVPRAAGCGAGVVAVRTAACDGGRGGRVSAARVRELKDALMSPP